MPAMNRQPDIDDATETTPAKRWPRFVSKAIGPVVLLAFIAGGICVYQAASIAYLAEKRLHSIILVTVVVVAFIEQEQRWPTSWDDLRAIEQVEVPSMYSWPDHADIVREFVEIDFDADLTEIATQTAEEFDAVRPSGPCYPYDDYVYVPQLLERAKAVGRQ